jgi:membrane protein DedA with SNARE-associated domain
MEQIISQFFSQYAYAPYLVYGAICVFMMLSAFGLPLPEEVVLISAGFVGYMSLHPTKYPPPYEGAQSVNVYVLAVVSFIAVMASDYMIYALGRMFGPRLFRMKWFSRFVSESALDRIRGWSQKYGSWAVVLFRFTPGLRFPGHLMCGATGLPRWKFLAIDSIAAGLSVPTQILLVSFYGQVILDNLARFKMYLFAALASAFVIFMVTKFLRRRPQDGSSEDPPGPTAGATTAPPPETDSVQLK